MRTIERDIVSALIFSSDGKLFQAKKWPNKTLVYPDTWHIPGGGVEEGEEKQEALTREIREELGLDLSPYSVELIDDTGTGESEKVLKDTGEHVLSKMKFFVYKVVLDKPAADIAIELDPEEFEQYHWIGLDELVNFALNPASISLFERLGYLK